MLLFEGSAECRRFKGVTQGSCGGNQSAARTCGLGALQGGAGGAVVQGDDAHRVLGPGAEVPQLGGFGVPDGGRAELALALPGAGVQDAVRGDRALGGLPGHAHRGGVHVGEGQVFGPVHSWEMEVQMG